MYVLYLCTYNKKNATEERTVGTVEAWNYIMKKVEHTVHRVRPDVFLRKQYDVIRGRQLGYFDQLSAGKKRRCTVSYDM